MRAPPALRLIVLSSVAGLTWLPAAPAAPAAPVVPAAPAAPVPIRQPQLGVALGGNGYSFLPTKTHRDSGSYVSTGQLGRGRYRFDESFPEDSDQRVGTGRAWLRRSDGATLTGTVTMTEVSATAPLDIHAVYDVVLTHGTRELRGAKLKFAGTLHNHIAPGPSDNGDEALVFSGTSSVTTRIGYWMVDSGGTVYPFGGAQWYGNAPTSSAVHIEPAPSRNGYWIVDASGHVFAFGTARWLGNADARTLGAGETVVSLSATPSARGYWLVTTRGHVLPFGDAAYHGDYRTLNDPSQTSPVVASASATSGKGYYLVASDGNVHHFGDARGFAGIAGQHLNAPIVGFVPTPDERSYWLVAADGGVFGAPFHGSMGNVHLNQPVVGMVRYGTGYMLIARDGGIFDFSKQLFFGSLGGAPPARPITSGASAG